MQLITIPALLCAVAITTALCFPVPYNEQGILRKLRLFQRFKAQQQAYEDKIAESQRRSEQAAAMGSPLSGQLGNILQQAAKKLLDSIESKPKPAPTAAPPQANPTGGAVHVSPGMGVKLHFNAPQQPYYQPVQEAPRRPRIIVPIQRQPAPPVSNVPAPRPVSSAPRSAPSVHIHPVAPVQPVVPVEPFSETPRTPDVHLVYPPQRQPPAQQPITPHLHIHPTSDKQKVAIKHISPMSPMKPMSPAQPVQKAPVLHIHSPTSKNGKKGGSEDKKENDVQLKLNMDFKAHNRTGFEELQRMVDQVEIQSSELMQRERANLQRQGLKESLVGALMNRAAAIQELSDLVTEQVMREARSQYYRQ